LLRITTAEIHFYLLEAYDLASRDIGSFSDPYCIIKCGSKEYNERDNYFLDKADPSFNKFFRFTGEFPGAPMLVIECWDYDDIFGDDLIGATKIDLDDRFFNPDWQALEEKPIEYRDIYHESTSLSQGTITCWVEIEPNDKSSRVEQKIWDVEPEPVKPY
jgi:Ca2+-dependent lipid-binding protein